MLHAHFEPKGVKLPPLEPGQRWHRIVDTSLPVPVASSFAGLQRTSIFTVGILSMIDGRRSISDLATALAQQWGVPKDMIAAELRPFLARLPFE